MSPGATFPYLARQGALRGQEESHFWRLEGASKSSHALGDTQAVFSVFTCLHSKINSQEAEVSCYFTNEEEISSSWHVKINDGVGGGKTN